MTPRVHLILRAVIDCAYLVRSRLSWQNKIRIFTEYIRLTLKILVRKKSTEAGTERVLDYRVRHFGIGSLQFLFREIFVRNEYFFEATVDRPLIFDCGANIGLATLFFKRLYPRCEIHAFEPDPETFQALKDNVDRNGLTDVHLHNVALAEKPGQLAFFVPSGPAGSPLMSTVSRRSLEASTRRIVVNASTLSTYMSDREVDFLKMDVEGAEECVLRELAVTGTLRQVQAMAVEYHHNFEGGVSSCGSFLQLLHDSGYRYQLDATCRGGGSLGTFQEILVRAGRPTPVAVRRRDPATTEEAVA